MVSPGYIPGPLVIPGVAEVRLKWMLANGRLVTNVLHASHAGGFAPTSAMANTIMNALVASGGWTGYHPHLADTTALQGIDIRDLNTANLVAWPSTVDAAAGTGTGDPLPQEVALVVSLRTALTGRRNRGRTYLTGFDTLQVDAQGHATGALTAAAEAFMLAVYAALFSSGLTMCIAQRAHAEYVSPFTGLTVPAEPAGHQTVLTMVVPDNVFDSQRRRK